MTAENKKGIAIFQGDMLSAELVESIIRNGEPPIDLRPDEVFLGGSLEELDQFLEDNPHPRLVVMGARLPDSETSMRMVESIRESDMPYKTVPIVIYSGFPREEYAQRFIDAGANLYIEKGEEARTIRDKIIRLVTD